MKIKYLAAAFTLFMAMIMAYFWVETDRNEQTVLDMVYYNKELKNISRAADTGMERTDLETEYDCSLLFLTDGDYKFKLNEAISRGNVVLDYEKDGAIAGKIVWDRENLLQNQWKQQMRKISSMRTGFAGRMDFIGCSLVLFCPALFHPEGLCGGNSKGEPGFSSSHGERQFFRGLYGKL